MVLVVSAAAAAVSAAALYLVWCATKRERRGEHISPLNGFV